ncbi:hypothetical protein [Nocardia sp. 348MFTsu5.1]|uniref:hypothetical protein n=1 Tax=Nocardia sp. 348MFTsu5.1 TaxID=1172185 RepID=UPI00036E962D|nr:hypothetical protein [Nocardia sp. 348MFTsu5.1]
MAIVVSYDRYEDLACEVVIFLDDETGDCFQVQRDLPQTPTSAATESAIYQISTGAGPAVEQGIVAWQRNGEEFEFALSPLASRMFGGNARLRFEARPGDGDTIEDIAAHLERMTRR